MMDHGARTLIVVLSMHRSGSSVTTSILERLGMSLGPFELVGAAPSNPHGHFESKPFVDLNIKVAETVLGIPDDLHQSEAALAAYLQSDGRFAAGAEIPPQLLQRGRDLIEALIGSGEIAGFKDPRTPILWPFWQRVLQSFPAVRVIPLLILRSPHEIAMSLCRRSPGWVAYWDGMDRVAVHLRRAREIVEGWSEPVPTVRFGDTSYLSDLAHAVAHCGLVWDEEKARALIDTSCIRELPARVHHEAQAVYEHLHGGLPQCDQRANEARLAADFRQTERMLMQRMRDGQLYAQNEHRSAQYFHDELQRVREQLAFLERENGRSREELERSSRECSQLRLHCEKSLDELDRLDREANEILAPSSAEGAESTSGRVHPDPQAVLATEFDRLAVAARRLSLQCRQQRETLQTLERHPLIRPIFWWRRWLKRVRARIGRPKHGPGTTPHIVAKRGVAGTDFRRERPAGTGSAKSVAK
jgi:hypothetical protein